MLNSSGLFRTKSEEDEKRFFLFSLSISVLGFLLSIYSLVHHFKIKNAEETAGFACNVNDIISCDKVALSQYSEVFSLPLGLWGLGFFLSIFCFLLYSSFGDDLRRKRNAFLLVFLLSALGSLASLTLGYISFQFVGSLCLVCLGVYFCNFLLFTLSFYYNKGFSLKGICFTDFFLGSLFFALLMVALSFLSNELRQFVLKQTPTKEVSLVEKQPKLTAELSSHLPLSTSPYMGKGEDYRMGQETAPIIIHEFADFECPSCKYAGKALKGLLSEYPGRILLVFRNYPLDQACNENISREFHKNACFMAQMARCAGKQGKFWEFHDLAFENQKDISEEAAKKWALSLGLKSNDLNKCLQDSYVLDKIRDDIALGDKIGVQGTPSIFLNGQRVSGQLKEMRQKIESILSISKG